MYLCNLITYNKLLSAGVEIYSCLNSRKFVLCMLWYYHHSKTGVQKYKKNSIKLYAQIKSKKQDDELVN